jgi:hypothetical protein
MTFNARGDHPACVIKEAHASEKTVNASARFNAFAK